MTPEDALDRVAVYLRTAESLLFITGAGISAESGLPTYRGIGGLYQDAETEEGIPIEEALSGQMLQTNPALTWKHIHRIESACRGSQFNRAHRLLAEMESRFARVWVLTQNVDGFHRAAGSEKVVDIHGDIHGLLCTRCDYRDRVEDYRDLAPCPTCPACDAVLRPDVVLFGEQLPSPKLALLQRELTRGFDVVVSIGTSSLFPYIVRPVMEAKLRGRPTVEINPGTTLISGEVDVKLTMGAGAACEALWQRLEAD